MSNFIIPGPLGTNVGNATETNNGFSRLSNWGNGSLDLAGQARPPTPLGVGSAGSLGDTDNGETQRLLKRFPAKVSGTAGVTPKDVDLIISAINGAIRKMTDSGLRHPNRIVNNTCSDLPWLPGCPSPNSFQKCGDQVEAVNAELSKLQLEANWHFLMDAGFGHAWGIAVSSNPADPKIWYDPRANSISIGQPCDSCKPWLGDSVYKDGKAPHPLHRGQQSPPKPLVCQQANVDRAFA